MALMISLITCISITILTFDYWLVERNQSNVWMPLANMIRKEVNMDSKIVTVTGLDPTLLNLARRKGWLTSAQNVDQDSLRYWMSQGAKYVAGSLNWQESYIRLGESESKNLLNELRCDSDSFACPQPPNYIY